MGLRGALAHMIGLDVLATMPAFTSTRQAAVLCPARIGAHNPSLGVPYGISLTTEKPTSLSLHDLYRAGIIQGPNALVIGAYGTGKSSILKTVFGSRALQAGTRVALFDRKSQQETGRGLGGEYRRLVETFGGTRIVFDPSAGNGVRINPLDPAISPKGSDTAGVGQNELLTLMANLGHGAVFIDADKDSMPVDALAAAHRSALQRAAAQHRIAVLEDVVEALYNPDVDAVPGPLTDDGSKQLSIEGIVTRNTVISWGLTVAAALRKWLPGGEYEGLFDGETRGPDGSDIDLSNPLIVFDTSSLGEGSTMLAAVMLLAASWIQGRWMRLAGDKLIIFEENYNASALPGVDAIQQAFALRGRGQGAAVVTVFHHLSQIPDGSKLWTLARDAEVVLINRQDRDSDMAQCMKYFGLPRRCADQLPTLPAGCSIVKIGRQPPEIWQHLRTRYETWMTNTDEGMSGRSIDEPGVSATVPEWGAS